MFPWMPLRCHSDIKWNAVIRHGLLRFAIPQVTGHCEGTPIPKHFLFIQPTPDTLKGELDGKEDEDTPFEAIRAAGILGGDRILPQAV